MHRNRVLCTVLVTIPWKGPPSAIEFYSIDNDRQNTCGVFTFLVKYMTLEYTFKSS